MSRAAFTPKVKYREHDRLRWCENDSRAPLEERSEFERDRSRIIHSAAFRRLQGKTQVFTAGEGDFFRTRLTHSLEVAQIGKGIAIRLGANTDIVEAACLVHDIGHPPFGHAGEKELKRLMSNFGGFEANAQNIRIITRLENKSRDYRGLNLTRAVVDGQLKYKNAFAGVIDREKDKFIYDDDVSLVQWASEEAQNTVSGAEKSWKSFECEIMDLADDIAYAVHDLEDSIHANYINAFTFFQNQDAIGKIISEVSERQECSRSLVDQSFEKLNREIQDVNPDLRMGSASESESDRKINRKRLTSRLIGKYIEGSQREERSSVLDSDKTQRYMYQVAISREHAIEISLIKELAVKFVIDSPQIRTLEEKGKYIIRRLFDKLTDTNSAEILLPNDWRQYLQDAVEAEGDEKKARARVVSDYISGMTDNYAQKTYARLFLPNQGSIFEVL